MAGTVEASGVAQLAGHAEERLAHEERAERGREERHGEALVRVQPAEASRPCGD